MSPHCFDEKEFWEACEDLHSRAGTKSHLDVRLYEGSPSFMRITRHIERQSPVISKNHEEPDEVDECMEEPEQDVIYSTISSGDLSSDSWIKVQYDVSYSQTYRVPVLYFHTLGNQAKGSDLQFIYDNVVPHSRSGELRSVSVIGGISQTNHPTTGIPCFFVHPCRTSEAMTLLTLDRSVSAREYLQIWIGLIGSAVGLNLPIELATV